MQNESQYYKLIHLGRKKTITLIPQATFQTAGTKYEEELDAATNKTKYTKVLAYRGGTNTLGIIFFCLTFGTVLGSIGRKAESVITFFKVLALLFTLSRKLVTQVIDEVIMKMVNGIMWISPIGISSVICAKILGVANLSR